MQGCAVHEVLGYGPSLVSLLARGSASPAGAGFKCLRHTLCSHFLSCHMSKNSFHFVSLHWSKASLVMMKHVVEWWYREPMGRSVHPNVEQSVDYIG